MDFSEGLNDSSKPHFLASEFFGLTNQWEPMDSMDFICRHNCINHRILTGRTHLCINMQHLKSLNLFERVA